MTEIVDFPDPFWLEHGEQIRTISEVLRAPKTSAGEEKLQGVFDNTIFIVYNRLYPVLASLITLVEYDEIGKHEGENYFSEPANQRIVVKAVKLLVEDAVKFPYFEEEKRKYEDYRGFFEGVSLRLSRLDKQIQAGHKLPNFVNSLAIIISQETAKLKGVENFVIKMEGTRKGIADYLPELARLNDGKILSEIEALIEGSLVSQPLQ